MDAIPLAQTFETMLVGVIALWVMDAFVRLLRGRDHQLIPDELLPDPRMLDLFVHRVGDAPRPKRLGRSPEPGHFCSREPATPAIEIAVDTEGGGGGWGPA